MRVRAYCLTGNTWFVHRRNGVFHIAWQDLQRDNVLVLTQTDLDESSLSPNGSMLIYHTVPGGAVYLAYVHRRSGKISSAIVSWRRSRTRLVAFYEQRS